MVVNYFVAYSILPGRSRAAAFQPILHPFRSEPVHFARSKAGIDSEMLLHYCLMPVYARLDLTLTLLFCRFRFTCPDKIVTISARAQSALGENVVADVLFVTLFATAQLTASAYPC